MARSRNARRNPKPTLADARAASPATPAAEGTTGRSGCRLSQRPAAPRRGFTLVDLTATVGFAVVLGAGAFVGLNRMRAAGGEQLCTMQLGSLGGGNAQYALSHQDQMIGYTWAPGTQSVMEEVANPLSAGGPVAAHAAQALDILRRRGRRDIPTTEIFLPDVQYLPLVLKDFQGLPLSDASDICPNHELLQKWRRRPQAFDLGIYLPLQPAPTDQNKRVPYMSSYTPTAGAFDRNQTRFGIVAAANRVIQGATQNQFVVPGNPLLGPSTMAAVFNPSQKVFMFDSHQRHFGGVDLFYCYPESVQPMLFFDGSVSLRMSGMATTPWQPLNPSAVTPQMFNYQPAPWEPPLASGVWGSQSVLERLRFTRNGLQGRDY